jgi:anti-sigma regulatory factor (Ser/Thr protein kinase)
MMSRGQRELADRPSTAEERGAPMRTVALRCDLEQESTLELDLERNVGAPAIARAAISACLLELGIDGSLGQTTVLLVSEVVSNAVRHSSAPPDVPIAMAAAVTEGSVRIAVSDGGEGFIPRPRDPERLGGGYGLYLVDKAATRWGVESAGGTTVWFELPR